MRVYAALLPPPEVQADLAAVVASVPGSGKQLAQMPAKLLFLRLANFGKVTLADANALHEIVEKEIAQWPPMTFRFRGGTALEPIGDDSAWASLEGDVDQVSHITDLMLRVVKRLGFLVDRRLPRTLVRVGRITPVTTVDYLQRLIDRLDDYTGPDWTCTEVTLLRLITDAGDHSFPDYDVLHRLPLQAVDPMGDVSLGPS
ncbi:MAG TPA: hypothetical protein VFD59_11855 [Nocardioidaceae bacterium]|nr:hypothetical protein [Nocardioidaceae bacterium]